METRPIAVLLFSCGALLAAACGATQPSEDEPSERRCEDLGPGAATLWTTEKREQLGLPVKILSGTLEAGDAEKSTNTLDRFTESWERLRQQNCLDHFVRKRLNATEYQTRQRCLDTAVETAKEVIDALGRGDNGFQQRIDNLRFILVDCGGPVIEEYNPPRDAGALDDAGEPFDGVVEEDDSLPEEPETEIKNNPFGEF